MKKWLVFLMGLFVLVGCSKPVNPTYEKLIITSINEYYLKDESPFIRKETNIDIWDNKERNAYIVILKRNPVSIRRPLMYYTVIIDKDNTDKVLASYPDDYTEALNKINDTTKLQKLYTETNLK